MCVYHLICTVLMHSGYGPDKLGPARDDVDTEGGEEDEEEEALAAIGDAVGAQYVGWGYDDIFMLGSWNAICI